MARCLLPIVLIAFPVLVQAQSDSRPATGAPHACPVTAAPRPEFVPPAPYLQTPPGAAGSTFWFGTEGLWTWLRSDGRWPALPHNEFGYRQKVFFWHRGYDWRHEPNPPLVITGRRLDGETLPVHVDDYANMASTKDGAVMVTAFKVPTLGWWEITTRYHENSLTFVVLVER